MLSLKCYYFQSLSGVLFKLVFILSETLTQAHGDSVLSNAGFTISVDLKGAQNFTVDSISFMLHRSNDASGVVQVEMLNGATVIAKIQLDVASDISEQSSFVQFCLNSPTAVPAGKYSFKISRQNTVKGTIYVRRYEASSTKLVHTIHGSLTTPPTLTRETEQELTGFFIKNTEAAIVGSKFGVGYASWIFNIPKKDKEYATLSKLTVRLKRGTNTQDDVKYRILIVNTVSTNIGWITKYYQTESLNITNLTNEYENYTLPLYHTGHDEPPHLAIGKGTTYHNIMLIAEGNNITEGQEYIKITNTDNIRGNIITGHTNPP